MLVMRINSTNQSTNIWDKENFLLIPQRTSQGQEVYQIIFSKSKITYNLFNPKEKTSIGLVEIWRRFIETKEFSQAIEFLLTEITSYSKLLADIFQYELESVSYLPHLYQELKTNKIITEEELARISTLITVIDGIDVEVNEFGASMDMTEIKYYEEYLEYIKKILSRCNRAISPIHQEDIEFTYYIAEGNAGNYDDVESSLKISFKNNIQDFEYTTNYLGVV